MDQLTESALLTAGISDPPHALRLIRNLAGPGLSDLDLESLLPLLLSAVAESSDPDRALAAFCRWFNATGSRFVYLQLLLAHPAALQMFCLVTGGSQYFADLLAREPELFEVFADPGARGGIKSAARLNREANTAVDACVRPELKRSVLRRWKAREMLRLGTRDLLGLVDMPSVAREFSNLADACVRKALEIARAENPLESEATPLPFLIVGMGKLGGRELNYSSDIDLIFVHGDGLPESIVRADGRKIDTTTHLRKIAEAVISALAEESVAGHVFRVDMRLRPEGRFGPLTRSLSSHIAYYQSWAEPWERQALLKARAVAGDESLGAQFIDFITRYVYRNPASDEFLASIRANKRRIEETCAAKGETETNVKTGYGGIRDVEFLVQALQLEYGGANPYLRTANTLSAIQRLRHAGLLTDEQARDLASDYQFLRSLEHRLQLLHGFQTQTLPPAMDTRERERLGRRMDLPGTGAFETALRERRDRVHACLQALFYHQQAPAVQPIAESSRWDDVPALLEQLDVAAVVETLMARLSAAGSRKPAEIIRTFRLSTVGNEYGGMPPDTPVRFAAIVPALLDVAERSANFDDALQGVESLALAVPNRAELYASFAESPDFLTRLVTFAGAAPGMMRTLARRQEWLESLFAPDEPAERFWSVQTPGTPGTAEGAANPFHARMRRAASRDAALDALAAVYQRELMHIAALMVWGELSTAGAMAHTTRLVEAALDALLLLCKQTVARQAASPGAAMQVLDRVAILGLGKLGGAELGFGSDWDVLFVMANTGIRQTQGADLRLAGMLVEQMIASVTSLAPRGMNVEMDLRLRPWGRKGALVQTMRTLLEYHRSSAEMWERQAALKVRPVAGNARVGRRFVSALHQISFGHPLSPEEDAAVQAMKRRIETERLKPGTEQRDVKLGHGGLTDIEWLAQRNQLLWGSEHAALRTSGTLDALAELEMLDLLPHPEAQQLSDTYLLLTGLRNALWLRTGQPTDILPDGPEARSFALIAGYEDEAGAPAESLLHHDVSARMRAVRKIFESRFYGRAG